MRTTNKIIALSIFLILMSGTGICHVFPKASSPKVGATINKMPATVKIWFDGKIDPASSRVWVMNDDSINVDKNNSRVDKSNPVLLEVDLKNIQPGKYHVYWSADALDGHHTQGDYFFIYKKSELLKTDNRIFNDSSKSILLQLF